MEYRDRYYLSSTLSGRNIVEENTTQNEMATFSYVRPAV